MTTQIGSYHMYIYTLLETSRVYSTSVRMYNTFWVRGIAFDLGTLTVNNLCNSAVHTCRTLAQTNWKNIHSLDVLLWSSSLYILTHSVVSNYHSRITCASLFVSRITYLYRMALYWNFVKRLPNDVTTNPSSSSSHSMCVLTTCTRKPFHTCN